MRKLNNRNMTVSFQKVIEVGLSPLEVMNETMNLRRYCDKPGNTRCRQMIKLYYRKYKGLVISIKRQNALNARKEKK